MFAGVQATDPNGRMKLIADEIAKAKPDLVGLQDCRCAHRKRAGKHRGVRYLAALRKELAAKARLLSRGHGRAQVQRRGQMTSGSDGA